MYIIPNNDRDDKKGPLAPHLSFNELGSRVICQIFSVDTKKWVYFIYISLFFYPSENQKYTRVLPLSLSIFYISF